MEKNELHTGKVISLGTEGEGIINTEGTTVFVPFCLVQEEVSFKVLKVKGNIAYGKLEKVLTPSKDRVAPPCPVFKKCGGCSLQHMNYTAQADFKRQTVARSLQKIGGISAEVADTVTCDNEYRYRNKLVLPIGVLQGETILGFYAPHSHRIVPIEDCLIEAEWVKDIIRAVKSFSKISGHRGYDEEKREGVLRRIVVREIKGKFVIALVAVKNINLSAFANLLKEKFENFTLLLNINPSSGNSVFGKEWHTVYGGGYFDAEDLGIVYRAGANTFLQVNDEIRTKLYSRVIEEADCDAVALDLYSGGGMLTAMLAKKCQKAYGIEIVEEASRCADELKVRNSLEDKMQNICGDVGENIEQVFKKTQGKKRIIVCDPPRKGMERSVVKAILRAEADKVILISCNPATLARDLGILTGALIERDGELVKCETAASPYEIMSITPFDMFPQTPHVETLVCLRTKS
ncbi:MAG: 23S rRNA (uracil(1939)-C(5))-methyltransferase RlmD [Clostridiales bacterium]|nr:23S rRNA (uracil(1939)-C(5))-methyltransferase RlmD [Clostridiales bacterium]